MKFPFIAIVFMFISCSKQSGHRHQEDKSESENPNQALYEQVMDIHDEVMPRMDDIERLKRTLKEQIANTPDMVVERKAELEKIISNLDSASYVMMDWMHKFNPLPDSVDQESAREYLETEMEKIKKVRDQMNESIEKAQQTVSKN